MLSGLPNEWDSCVTLVNLQNPIGDTIETRDEQKRIADDAAQLADLALAQVSQRIGEMLDSGGSAKGRRAG